MSDPRAASCKVRGVGDANLYPDPTGSFRLDRFCGKSILVGRSVFHGWAGASWRQKLKAGPVLVYPAIPNVDRDAERVGEFAGSAG
jgi:hypothetical protein